MPDKKPLSFDNGEVDDGTTNPTMIRGSDVEVTPLDEDGKPLPGANVTLKCGDPPRTYTGKEQGDGSYMFKDAIRAKGSDKCVLTVEKPG